MRKLLILLFLFTFASCSWMPFIGKKQAEAPVKTDKGEVVDTSGQPKPGDIKVVDGVEYIYAKNRKYQLTPYEPEYEWVRKDQYSPALVDSLADKVAAGGSSASAKDRADLEARMAKLEADQKAGSASPQGAYPAQTAAVPNMAYLGVAPGTHFSYPSPKMKRRVVVLPLEDHTNYKDEHLEELTTKHLVSRLENSGAIIPIDLQTTAIKGDPSTPAAMKTLNELYGVQAVIKGNISDVYTSTSKVEGKEDRDVSFALSKISLDIYNTETGKLLRQLNARNPFFLSREGGDMAPEKAKVRAIDLAIELVAEDLLKTLLSLDWHARVASVDTGRVYINAGRLSGLEKGDVLEVYSPGVEVIDKSTNLPLGRTKGSYKGDVQVVEVFGVDACWATSGNPAASFSPTDLVYLKKK